MSDRHCLPLSGDCDLRRIRALREEVASALEATSVLEIDCADVERIDLSFVQLIVSAARTAERQVKQVRLANLSETARSVFVRAGVSLPGLPMLVS